MQEMDIPEHKSKASAVDHTVYNVLTVKEAINSHLQQYAIALADISLRLIPFNNSFQ